MNLIEQIKNWMDNSILDELIVVVALLAIVEAIAQNNLRNSESIRIMFGLSAYIIVGFLLHYAYSKFPLSKINVMWSCISIILATSLGYYLYNEDFHIYSFLAIIFALLAIYFANI